MTRTNGWMVWAVALAFSGAWSGCGGAGAPGAEASGGAEEASSGGDAPVPNSAVHQQGSNQVEATVGPPGGSLSLASGPKVEIPPGAVTEAVSFVLKEAPRTTAFLNAEYQRPWGPTFVVSPGVDAPEGRAITVSVPLAAYPDGWGEIGIAFEYPVADRVGAEDSEHTRWQYDDARLSGGRAVAELPAVNGYRLQFVITNLEAQ